ncbi:hypothetical protein RB653_002110 [Dictyostelium firmibasis]|uniref:Uncharacterized protein n=1 Tax=Dictyostelium firmibasis TaxID=79012 RepID=A0AAN7TNA6_9MYCE
MYTCIYWSEEQPLQAPILKPDPTPSPNKPIDSESNILESILNLDEKETNVEETISPSLVDLKTEDIYFNIDWKCNTQDIFINDMGYYDIASILNPRHNCHAFKTPCEEIVSLNITDCPGSQPFNSSCRFVLNYYRDTINCDNIPVLVTDFNCQSFGKHHDLGAIDVICKRFERETADPEKSSSTNILTISFNFQLFILISLFLFLIIL